LSKNEIIKRVEFEKAKMIQSIAKRLGIDPKVVSKSKMISRWEEERKKFLEDPIKYYNEKIKHSERLIEEYKRRIKKHEMKIMRLKTLIIIEEMKREGKL